MKITENSIEITPSEIYDLQTFPVSKRTESIFRHIEFLLRDSTDQAQGKPDIKLVEKEDKKV